MVELIIHAKFRAMDDLRISRRRWINVNGCQIVWRLNWGASVIDGFEGMEGNGPKSGTPVASRIALASTDYVAVDRVAALRIRLRR